jgi:hypothetical protein
MRAYGEDWLGVSCTERAQQALAGGQALAVA